MAENQGPYNQTAAEQRELVTDIISVALSWTNNHVPQNYAGSLPELSESRQDEIVSMTLEGIDYTLSAEDRVWWQNEDTEPAHDKLTKIALIVSDFINGEVFVRRSPHSIRFNEKEFAPYYASRFMSAWILQRQVRKSKQEKSSEE